jgi:hypothetical protein
MSEMSIKPCAIPVTASCPDTEKEGGSWGGMQSSENTGNLKMKRNLPESVRKELSKAGKIGASRLTHEQRVKGGKNRWKNRIAKARELEEKKAHANQSEA